MIYPKSEIRWKGYSQIKSIFLCILRFSCGTCNVSCKYYFIFATLPKFYYLEGRVSVLGWTILLFNLLNVLKYLQYMLELLLETKCLFG